MMDLLSRVYSLNWVSTIRGELHHLNEGFTIDSRRRRGDHRMVPFGLWVLKTSSAGLIDAKRAVKRQPY